MQNSDFERVQEQLTCDQETFQRVWRRVMPEDRVDCPFVLNQDAPTPQTETEASVPSAPSEQPSLPPDPPVQDPGVPASMRSEENPTSLGPASAIYMPLLQELISKELLGWRYYQQLARQVSGTPTRILSSMAADEHRHAKRLSAAGFLISGVRYLPLSQKLPMLPGTFPAALREAFSTEQQSEAAYRTAAAETLDEALRTLYLELAEEECAHASLIRNLLEQL